MSTASVGDLSVYIEAAGQQTLRRTLRAVLDHLGTLTQIAAASAAIGHSTKDHAHDTYTAAAQAAQAATAPGSDPDSHALATAAAEAYFTYLGFACAAAHIGYCVNGVTAAIAGGLGLASWPPDDSGHQEPGPGT